MEYLGAWGTLIHTKKLEVENLVSDSLKKPFVWVKILKFFDADQGFGIEKKFGSGMEKIGI
jgi:hypothetical protein